MKVGTRVLFVADWSSFVGMHGHITQVEPRLMAVIGDDPRPMAIGESEVIPDPEPQHTVAGE